MKPSKAKVRGRLLEKRRKLTTEYRVSASARIVEQVLQQKVLIEHPSIGLYWPTNSEVDIRPLMNSLRPRGTVICFPKVRLEGDTIHMDFFAVETIEELKRGFKGIFEPVGIADITLPSLLIVPGVGFGRNKTRLGYGGGTYDRYLASRKYPPFLIGVGFDETIETEIPSENHDWRMNLIITEAEVLP